MTNWHLWRPFSELVFLFYFLSLKASNFRLTTVTRPVCWWLLFLSSGLGDFEHRRPHWKNRGRAREGGDCRNRRLGYRRLRRCQVCLYRRRRGQGQLDEPLKETPCRWRRSGGTWKNACMSFCARMTPRSKWRFWREFWATVKQFFAQNVLQRCI